MVEENTQIPRKTDSSPEPDAEFMSRLETSLVELSRSLKAVNFYPRGHPTLVATLEKCGAILAHAIGDAKQIGLTISKDGFTYQSKPVGEKNINVPPFAREFFHRQIKKIFFMPEITVVEIENFLRVVAMEEDLFRGEGRAEDYLVDVGVEHIWFNEMRFGQGRKLEDKEEEAPGAGPGLDEKLAKLIATMRSEKDHRRFLGLSREAVLFAHRLIEEAQLDAAFEVAKVFREFFAEGTTKSAAIAEASSGAFDEILNPKMMENVLKQLTLLSGPKQEEIISVMGALEERLVDSILDKLTTNEALYSHRALIQVLLQFPATSVPGVEKRLGDHRWFVVRKMAFLLGELASKSSVPGLIEASANHDPRVSKEAIKSLAKIKTPEAIRHLLGLIDPKIPNEILAHTIRTLAGTKETAAVTALMKYLKGRSTMLDEIEMYQEAVRALGKIGSQQAVPILEEILNRKNLLAKQRSAVLAADAAEALGAIGGANARGVLEKGLKNRNPDIATACRKALAAIDGAPPEPSPAGAQKRTEG